MALGMMMTLHTAPKAQSMTSEKLKTIPRKAEVKSVRRQALDWDKIFAPPQKKIYICMFNKEFLSKVYKELLKFNKKANNLILR